MTKFDIFVVNLKRSTDRREAMRKKIKRIRGFAKIYIDDEMVVDSAESQNLNQKELCVSTTENSPASWCKKSGEASSSASADFLLEAEKRGSPPKSEKRQLLARRGSGAGGAALLRKEKNNKENAESNAESNRDSSVASLPQNDNFSVQDAESSADSVNLQSGLPREQSSLAMTENKAFAESNLDSADSQNLQDRLPRRLCESPRNDGAVKSPQDEFADFALHFHFFDATDATKFKNGESPLPPQYSSKLTRFVKGKDLSFGEIACFSSHYRLWQKCVELDSPIIVLEDDIDFMQDFCQIVDIFKSPFEYVRLYYLFDRKITHLYDKFHISFDRTAGTQGYYLTPQAAQKFIKNARFWLFCVDDYMDMFFIHSVKNIIFKPFIISEDSLSAGTSTILGREKPKMRFYQKLTRELSRIYFFVIRKYMYFALSFLRNLGVKLRTFFRANRR